MAKYHIMQITPWSSSQTPLADVIASLVWGLKELGHDASWSLNTWSSGARHIVLCPHLLDDNIISSLPQETVFYNLEQIDPFSPFPISRIKSFANRQVWDYSTRNISLWHDFGIAATHVPIAWYPRMERVSDSGTKDIDFLFFGALNKHRVDALNTLTRSGLKVHLAQKIFGDELDALLARTKIAINLHCYNANIFESVRVSYLLANGIPVISERSSSTEVPAPYESVVYWTDIEQLEIACKKLSEDEAELERLSRQGRLVMREQPVTLSLAAALRASSKSTNVTVPPPRAKIPGILHFVWIGDEGQLPKRCIDSWRDLNPNVTIRVWGNEALEQIPWINAHHIQQMASQELAGVADLMRWEILFREGGIAIDADSTCLNPLPDWLFDCEMFACWENEVARPGLISNGTVGSIAANPFLMRLIQDILIQPSIAGRRAWETTGPLPFTEAHRRHRYYNLTILPSHFFLPSHYSGCRYAGGGPIYADQGWESTRQLL